MTSPDWPPYLLAGAAAAAQAAQTSGTPAAADGAAPVLTPSPEPSADALAGLWRERTEVDLAAFVDAMRSNYIHAAYV